MSSLDHYSSDFPQPQAFFYPNFHNSSPCSSSLNDEPINPFHHQSYYLSNQMGIFYQDPNLIPPNNYHHHYHNTNFPNYNPTPQTEEPILGLSSPKKDRHTKISTAHGFRDRRVRLSMAIAREFFDLQDLLGFDKASKTIGWLLAKSKNAIQDLALAKNGHGSPLTRSNSTSCSSHQEQVFIKRRRKCSGEEVENQANVFIAKENRAKARARARERTKGKLSTLIKPIQVDDLGFQTGSSSSQFLTDFNAQDFARSNDLVEEQGLSAPLHNLSSPIDDNCNDPVRVNNHLPGLLLGSDYYYTDQASATMYSTFSGLNMLPHFYNW